MDADGKILALDNAANAAAIAGKLAMNSILGPANLDADGGVVVVLQNRGADGHRIRVDSGREADTEGDEDLGSSVGSSSRTVTVSTAAVRARQGSYTMGVFSSADDDDGSGGGAAAGRSSAVAGAAGAAAGAAAGSGSREPHLRVKLAGRSLRAGSSPSAAAGGGGGGASPSPPPARSSSRVSANGLVVRRAADRSSTSPGGDRGVASGSRLRPPKRSSPPSSAPTTPPHNNVNASRV